MRIIALLFLVLCALPVGSAFAFLEKDKYTDAEKAGFAFYSLSKTKPDFESWVMNTPAYKSAPPEQRSEMLGNEVNRLATGFRDFHPDEDLIKIRAPVILDLPQIGKNDPQNQPVIISFEFEKSSNLYFPVMQGGTWMALVPEDTKIISGIQLGNAAELESFIRKGGFQNARRKGAYAVAELTLRAISADARAPLQMDGKPMWTMLVQVGSIMVYSEKNSALMYTAAAPWYMNTRQQGLINLYGN